MVSAQLAQVIPSTFQLIVSITTRFRPARPYLQNYKTQAWPVATIFATLVQSFHLQRIYTLDELPQVVAAFWQNRGVRCVFAFDGAMGSGKTTFIHALCDYLGVTDPVSSPTFSLINEYQTAAGETLLHMDWYRLNSVAEAMDAGVEEALHSGAICLIEWPQRAAALLPADTVWVHLQEAGPGKRQLQVVQTPPVS